MTEQEEREAMALSLWDDGLVRPESVAFAVVDAFIAAGWHPEPEITDEVFILDGELARDEAHHDLLPLPMAFPTREAAQLYVDSAGPLWGSWGIHRVPVAEGETHG